MSSVLERIRNLTKITSGITHNGTCCWIWEGSAKRKKTKRGNIITYGNIDVAGKTLAVHRVTYELLVGPIPPGLQIDHLCKRKLCCNPDHLEPVTARENSMRSQGIAFHYSQRSDCVNGHTLSGENLLQRSDGGRRCRECSKQDQARYRMNRKLLVGNGHGF